MSNKVQRTWTHLRASCTLQPRYQRNRAAEVFKLSIPTNPITTMSTATAKGGSNNNNGTEPSTDPAWEAYQQEVAEAAVDGGGEEKIDIPSLPTVNNSAASTTTSKATSDDDEKISGYQVKWNTNLDHLKTYKEEHGHVNVTRTDDKVLGRWVDNQRQAYRNLVEGKPSSLTPERIKELEKVCVLFLILCVLHLMT